MTKEELKQEAEKNAKSLFWYVVDMSRQPNKEELEALVNNYMEIAEPREKQIAELGERCLQLQKDKGNLTDRVRELEQQIEKMKSCDNCNHCGTNYNCDYCLSHAEKAPDWELIGDKRK